MTHIKSIILACAALLALASCDNNYPIPPYVEPQFTLAAGERVISIDTLKSLHTLGSTPRYIGEDFVVNGVVVGDDESGNIYKSIYLQDATGGINLAIDNVNMYNTMPVGQQVYVRLKGLFVGDYNNGYQLGDTVTDSQYGLEMARYDWANEYVDSTRHFFPVGKPDAANVPAPRLITSADEITTDMYCTLVTLDNVSIPEAAGGALVTWATTEQTVNRTVEFADGSNLIVRTSGYCNFYADPIPAGSGSLTGILAVFGSTRQLYLRSRADINLRDE